MSILVPAIVVVVAILSALLVQIIRKGNHIHDYFANATQVYVGLGDEGARLAAITAARIAPANQRDKMLLYLGRMRHDCIGLAEKVPDFKPFADRLSILGQDGFTNRWNAQRVLDVKKDLGLLHPRYLKALKKADPMVFVRDYPSLFTAETIPELFDAAKQLDRPNYTQHRPAPPTYPNPPDSRISV